MEPATKQLCFGLMRVAVDLFC